MTFVGCGCTARSLNDAQGGPAPPVGLLGPGALVPPEPRSWPAGCPADDGVPVPADDGVPVPALDGVPAEPAPEGDEPPVTAPTPASPDFFFFFLWPAEAGISEPVAGADWTGGCTVCELLSLPLEEITTISRISSTRPPSATARRRR
ncbi:MAG: hypothetical protein QOI65_671 [Thermoleophilaceae bacterium]|nr:hypothetical protein [Thermoleophilaceae bacterium]